MLTKRRIGPFVDILSGYPFDSHSFGDSGSMPVVRIRDVVRGKSATYYSGSVDDRYVIRDGDILIGMDGEFNRARWHGGQALLNQRVCRIQSCSRELDDRYLFHMLPRALEQIEQVTSYVTVKHLSVKQIREIEILMPPVGEQRRIAEILDKADALRAKRRAALAQLDTLTQSIFLEMFGDPVSNPRGWRDDSQLGDIAQIASGVTKGRALNGKPARTVPYLSVANVQDRALELDDVKVIEATEDEIARYRLQENDLLLTEGGDPDKLGRGSLWKGQLPECIHQNHIFRVRISSPDVDPVFLNWLIGSERGKRYFLKSAKQTTGIASINMTQLRGFPLLIPPLDRQRLFAKQVETLASVKSLHADARRELDALFASLQHRAFRGEL